MEAIKNVLEVALPAMVSQFLAIFMEALNNSFVGHLGREEVLAGVGMANMHLNIFMLSLIWGMNSTFNTLLTQAYGFGDLRQCGVYLNRSRIIVTLVFLPMSIFILNTEWFFSLLGFDPSSSH